MVTTRAARGLVRCCTHLILSCCPVCSLSMQGRIMDCTRNGPPLRRQRARSIWLLAYSLLHSLSTLRLDLPGSAAQTPRQQKVTIKQHQKGGISLMSMRGRYALVMTSYCSVSPSSLAFGANIMQDKPGMLPRSYSAPRMKFCVNSGHFRAFEGCKGLHSTFDHYAI